MSKRTADELDPRDDGDDRGGSDPHSHAQPAAAARHGEEQTEAVATQGAPSDSTQTGATTSGRASDRPFDRLATVELQLIMRCCDQTTLIALARCSRFTLTAASSPFVWQPLSPIRLQCDWPLELRSRLSKSLLRHADISVTWRLRTVEAASADQSAALATLPRIRGLAVESAFDPAADSSTELSDEGAALLFEAMGGRIDDGGALTSLSFDCRELLPAGVVSLAAFIERSRTLASLSVACASSNFPITALAAALIQCRTLTSLEIGCHEIQPDAFRALATVVRHSPSLTTLILFRLRCDAESVAVFAAAVAQSRSLTDLQLPDCGIDDADMEALTAAIEQSSSAVRRLDVSGNQLGCAGAASLAHLLASERCALTSLNISGNNLGSAGALALVKPLQASRKLTALHLSHTCIGRVGIAVLVAALQQNPHRRLRVLGFSGNRIDQPTAAALAEAVRRSGAFERLEVSECSLSDEGLATLAAAIEHSRSLQYLDVSYNPLGAAGAAALAAAISACPALTALDVSGNEIGHAGLAALAPALVNVCSLKLNDCSLIPQSGESLAWLMQNSLALQLLDVGCNDFEARGATLMATSARPFHRRHRTDRFQPSDRGARALAASLEQLSNRSSLTALIISRCDLDFEDALALVRAATHAPRLRTLNLRRNSVAFWKADRQALIAACGSQPHFELKL